MHTKAISRALKLVFGLALGLATLAVSAAVPSEHGPASYTPDVTYTLKTAIAGGKLAFVGVGDGIDGQVNPTLHAQKGQVVQVTLIDGDGATHDWVMPDFKAATQRVNKKGASSSTVFRVRADGEFAYWCSLPGHRAAGMEGKFVVGEQTAAKGPALPEVSRDPSDLPAPVGNRGPKEVSVHLTTEEVKGRLKDGTAFTYWTFDGKVPGPMLRVRVGDTVHLSLSNAANSTMIHSIDLHAVTGPGGGAANLQVPPGGTKTLTFKALKPGLFVYHCATPMVAEHIANGMFGMILVEPKGGLAKVDREYYIMQSEIYTESRFNTDTDHAEFDLDKLLNEQPEYYVFNGAVGALTKVHKMKVNTGDTVRIFFGDAGPNKTASFHVIGEIMDKVYDHGTLVSPPQRDVQTTTVPPGGATMVELKTEVPGKYILVDHALSRLERGLVGFLHVEGKPRPDIYRSGQ